MQRYFWALPLVIMLAAACNNDESKTQGENADTASTTVNTTDTGATHIFTLPAPLQVATMLKLEKEPYYPGYLSAGVPPTSFSDNFSRSLNMGAYMVDMGYACIYDQRQTGLNYAKAVQTLMNDLGITSSIKDNMVKRFEANIRNTDSLYTIILESYGQAHNYFQENGREETGLFIMCGSYIEGLNLTLQSKDILSNTQLKNLAGQQKVFLDNIIQLCDYMVHKPEVKQLKEMMKEIQAGFKGVTVKTEETKDGMIAVSTSINNEQLKRLTERVSAVRKRITAA